MTGIGFREFGIGFYARRIKTQDTPISFYAERCVPGKYSGKKGNHER